jgi:hypothetical protein
MRLFRRNGPKTTNEDEKRKTERKLEELELEAEARLRAQQIEDRRLAESEHRMAELRRGAGRSTERPGI